MRQGDRLSFERFLAEQQARIGVPLWVVEVRTGLERKELVCDRPPDDILRRNNEVGHRERNV